MSTHCGRLLKSGHWSIKMAVYKIKTYLYTRLHTREKEGEVHNMSKSENEDKQYSDMTNEELDIEFQNVIRNFDRMRKIYYLTYIEEYEKEEE